MLHDGSLECHLMSLFYESQFFDNISLFLASVSALACVFKRIESISRKKGHGRPCQMG